MTGKQDGARKHRRIPLNTVVQFRNESVDDFMREHAANISLGGMFIRTTAPRPKGDMIYLHFALDDGDKLIEGLGKVVHVNPPDHPAPGMGVEFVDLDDNSRRLIDEIIAERASQD